MSTELSSQVAIIPKNTVIHFNGEPCRLVEDTQVVNAYMAKVGFEEYKRLTMLGVSSGSPVAAIPASLNLTEHRTSDR